MALARALWVVLPVRGEATGKSRLAAALDPVARRRLNRALLAHTLAVIEAWQGGLARCIVVSACARSLRVARTRGAIALREPAPRRGLNRAAALGVKLARRRGARRVLILPGDLPRLSRWALRRLENAARDARAVIVADRRGSGTNALLVPAAGHFAFAYGPGSFAAHLDRLRRRGWRPVAWRDAALGFDLDTPADLEALTAEGAKWPNGIVGGTRSRRG